jgi:UDP-N-acetylmuramoylalanine--D-glutamate ligase
MSLRFSELDGTRVGVWGAGREIGSFAAQLARHLPLARIAVVALDADPDEDVRATLGLSDARLATGTDVTAALADCDVVVRSPGVSIYRPELRKLRGAGIPVTTATALWLAERNGSRVIAVTGTKGKSTTATLLAHLARAGGQNVALAGNIGVPALDLLDRPSTEPAIVELSSYQIADLETGPEVAVITNLFREHTDWHGSEEVYRSDKLRLLELPGLRVAIVNGRDERLVRAVRADATTALYGLPGGWDTGVDGVTLRGELVVPAAELPLRGEHNALNLCAALAALSASGIVIPPLPDALRGFQALPHRLEVVSERDGIRWVDDSISTTPESTLAAIASFADHEIVLLGGGQDRGQDYTQLGRMLAERGAAVVGLPTTGSRLVAAARTAGVPAPRAIVTNGMEEAVLRARALAAPGTTILLSPAAPSYDSYRNFEERAGHFRALV